MKHIHLKAIELTNNAVKNKQADISDETVIIFLFKINNLGKGVLDGLGVEHGFVLGSICFTEL